MILLRKKQDVIVSVIITTYNRRYLLPYALQSVIDQTYQNFEIIIINDKGDDVSDIIESFHSNKIILITNLYNSGPSFSRNSALKIAKGEVICYLDDDDLYLPKHLEVIVDEFSKNESINIAYVDSEYVDEKLDSGERKIIKNYNRFIGNSYSFEKLLISNYIPINSLAHRKDVLKFTGLFNEDMRLYEDWDMLLRMGSKFKFYHINETTTEVRNRIGKEDDLLMSGQNITYFAYSEMYNKYNSGISDIVLTKRNSKLCHYLKVHLTSKINFRKKIYILWLLPGQCTRYIYSIIKYIVFSFSVKGNGS